MSSGTTIGASAPVRPGRLGDPTSSLGTDPRADPRMMAVLSPLGLGELAPAGAPGPDTSLEDLRAFVAEVEVGFEGLFTVLAEGAPRPDDVTSEERTIEGPDGNAITLYIVRPSVVDGPLPCLLQVHGGGMVMLSAAGPLYRNWREELASAGAVVVGVEYRNAGGVLGSHPYPAGLDDCTTALHWVDDHREELGVTGIVVTGDSGGANLSLALAIRAKREGWLGAISGVSAQSPYIVGDWPSAHGELASPTENDRYWLNRELFPALSAVYDPGAAHRDEATCWPYRATDADLAGLPPHVVVVNECDPLRDEGLAYHRRLLANGVPSVGKVNLGLCHVGELLFRAAMPDVYLDAVRSVVGFARSLPAGGA